MLATCKLPGCPYQAEFIMDDGRPVCGHHARIIALGQQQIQDYNEKRSQTAEMEEFFKEAAEIEPGEDETPRE